MTFPPVACDTWTTVRAGTPLTHEVPDDEDVVHLDLGPREVDDTTSIRLEVYDPAEVLDTLIGLFTRMRAEHAALRRAGRGRVTWPPPGHPPDT